MPHINDEMYLKLQELLKKEEQEKEQLRVDRNVYIEQLSERVQGLLDLNKTYGTKEAYATKFAEFLDGDMEAHHTDTLFFDWVEIQRYLTKRCLQNYSYLTLDKEFRKYLKNRGYCCRVDNRWNVFTVKKCEPRKVVEK